MKRRYRIFVVLLLLIVIDWLIPVKYTEERIRTLATGQPYTYDNYEWFIQSMDSYQTSFGTMYYHDHWPQDWDTIVLLHWTPTNSWLYRKMIQPLVDKWYRVIAPDMIWFGVSTKNWDSHAYATRQQTFMLMEMLDEIGVDTFYVWWHDQWSLWVWDLMQNYKDRLSSNDQEADMLKKKIQKLMQENAGIG